MAETWLQDRRARKLALGVAIGVSAAVAALITLPLVPVEDVHATPIPDINEDAIETIGWPAFTANVARIWNKLPESERSTAVVYASNYGEAGAIARRSRVRHPARTRPQRLLALRPPAGWRPPVIVVGYHDPEALRGDFRGCSLSARIDNGVDLDNEEQGAAIWTCASTVDTWSTVWPRLRSLNP